MGLGNILLQIPCPPFTDWGWLFSHESNSLKIKWYKSTAPELEDISKHASVKVKKLLVIVVALLSLRWYRKNWTKFKKV